MVYDSTTSTPLLVGGFEPGDPTVGAVTFYNGNPSAGGLAEIVTASSQGVPAYEGSQFAELYRTSAQVGFYASCGSATGANDVTTSKFAVYLANGGPGADLAMEAGTSANLDNMCQFDLYGKWRGHVLQQRNPDLDCDEQPWCMEHGGAHPH